MKREVPSFAEVRPHLPPKVMTWCESVLMGESNNDYLARTGQKESSLHYYQRMVADWAGFELRKGTIREGVLLMRIRELEESK